MQNLFEYFRFSSFVYRFVKVQSSSTKVSGGKAGVRISEQNAKEKLVFLFIFERESRKTLTLTLTLTLTKDDKRRTINEGRRTLIQGWSSPPTFAQRSVET